MLAIATMCTAVFCTIQRHLEGVEARRWLNFDEGSLPQSRTGPERGSDGGAFRSARNDARQNDFVNNAQSFFRVDLKP